MPEEWKTTVFGGRSDGTATACTGCSYGCVFPQGGLVREMRSCRERAEALTAKVIKLAASVRWLPS